MAEESDSNWELLLEACWHGAICNYPLEPPHFLSSGDSKSDASDILAVLLAQLGKHVIVVVEDGMEPANIKYHDSN